MSTHYHADAVTYISTSLCLGLAISL